MSKKLLGHFDLHNNSEEDVVDNILNALDEEGFFDGIYGTGFIVKR